MRKALISQGFSVWHLNRPQHLVGEDGFEPSKLEATDLQSAPFGRSGILPYLIFAFQKMLGHRTVSAVSHSHFAFKNNYQLFS